MILKPAFARVFLALGVLLMLAGVLTGYDALAQGHAAPPNLPNTLPAAEVINYFQGIHPDAQFKLILPDGQVVKSRAGDLLNQGVLLNQASLGRYQLEVSAPGYTPATYTLILQADMTVTIEQQSVSAAPPPVQPTTQAPVLPPVNMPPSDANVNPDPNPQPPTNPVNPPVMIVPTLTLAPSPAPVTSLSIVHNLGERADIQLVLTLPSGQVFSALSGDFPNGNIAIDHLQAGDYSLGATVTGYAPVNQTFPLAVGQQMGILLEFIADPVEVADSGQNTFASLEGRVNLQGEREGLMVALSLRWPDNTLQERFVPVNTVFALADLPAGDYVLEAQAEGFLSRRLALTLAAGEALTLPPVVLRAGDVNQDNVIDLLDITLLAANFNAPAPSPALDVNGDGWIDIQDLSLVGAQYGLAGPLAWDN